MRRIANPTDILARAAIERDHYAAQLHLALKHSWDSVLQFKEWTARALLVLGEFDQARQMVRDEPALANVLQDVDAAQSAVDEDDAAYCDCRHIVNMSPTEAGEHHRELSSYTPTGLQVYSKRHGGLVSLYRCVHCGHKNALARPPDEMLGTALALQAAADNQTRRIRRDKEGKRYAPADYTKADQQFYLDATKTA